MVSYTTDIDSIIIKVKGNRSTKSDIKEYIEKTIDLSEFGNDIYRHYNNNKGINTDYFTIARETNKLYSNVITNNYKLAVQNSINILNSINNIADTNKINNLVINFISKYGVLIASIADANSPEEIKTAIENAALPAGSRIYKKYNTWNLSLNGYIGASFPFKPNNNNSWSQTSSLTAPIGLNLSVLSMKKGGSFSLYIPLIDVGAIANYQLKNDSTFEQKIYLSNIFSPGCYVVYGFWGKWPLAFGVGGQYGPGLVKIGSDVINPSWQWRAFLTIDLPIFNLTQGIRKR